MSKKSKKARERVGASKVKPAAAPQPKKLPKDVLDSLSASQLAVRVVQTQLQLAQTQHALLMATIERDHDFRFGASKILDNGVVMPIENRSRSKPIPKAVEDRIKQEAAQAEAAKKKAEQPPAEPPPASKPPPQNADAPAQAPGNLELVRG